MFTNSISKFFIVVLVTVAVLATVSFASHLANASVADRSYDAIEGLRAVSVQADRSYDAVEQLRVAPSASTSGNYDHIEAFRLLRGAASLTSIGYEAIEQMRLDRAFQANRSYDQIETLRLSR